MSEATEVGGGERPGHVIIDISELEEGFEFVNFTAEFPMPETVTATGEYRFSTVTRGYQRPVVTREMLTSRGIFTERFLLVGSVEDDSDPWESMRNPRSISPTITLDDKERLQSTVILESIDTNRKVILRPE